MTPTPSGPQDLDDAAYAEAAETLYAAPLTEFMATRTALVAAARAAKNRPLAARIGKLRKPSVAAAVANQLVRSRPELLERVRSVGEQLRAAQANMHGTALAALRPARDEVIEAVLTGAREIARAADSTLTPAAADEIRDTVIAALASAEAADAFASGALTRTLSYSGFGEVDLADAVVEGFRRPAPTLTLLRRPAPRGDPTDDDTTDDDSTDDDADADDADADAADADDADADAEEAEGVPEDVEDEDANDDDAEDEDADESDAETAGLDDADAEKEPADERSLEVRIDAAGAAYADAAGQVAASKRAVAETSTQLDAAKRHTDELRTALAEAEQELADLFAADSAAREAVTAAVRERQAAAELLARLEAEG